MAKKAAKAAADKSNGEPKKMTQIAAVEQITKLYPKDKPRELAPKLKAKFGIDLTPQRISMYRVHLKKRAGKPVGKRGRVPGAKAGGSDMTISQYVATQKMINDLGGEAKVQKMLDQYAAAKKLFANA